MTPARKKTGLLREEGDRKEQEKGPRTLPRTNQDASQWHSNQTLTGIRVLEMLVSYMIDNLYLCRVDTMIQNRTTSCTIVRKRQNNHVKRALTMPFVPFLSKTDSP